MMTPSMLAALTSSLGNAQHDWKVLAVSSHSHMSGIVEVTSKTFQLRSDPLDVTLIVMAELEDDVFASTSVYFRGSSFETTEESIYTTLNAMAGPEISSMQNAFEVSLRKKFASASISASGAVSCTA